MDAGSTVTTRLGLDPAIVRQAREIAPDIPVVYVSGVSAEEWQSKGVPNSVMIAKPFVVGELIAAVTLLLAEGDR